MSKKVFVYRYKVNGIKNELKICDELMKIDGVVAAYFEDGYLNYEIDERTDEYEILIAAMNLCENDGGELIVGEEDLISEYDSEDGFSSAVSDENLNDTENGFEEEEKVKPTLYDAEEENGDHIVAAEKKLKTESTIRFGEISAALVLFLIASFLTDNAKTALSVKNVMLIIQTSCIQ